jgi:hypothetical protein
MGLNINGARFLLAEKSRGIRFGRTLTLGKQSIYMNDREYAKILSALDTQLTTPEFADDFFSGIGAQPLVSMDASTYEGATFVHDMNQRIESQYHEAFDTVIDGGTLEHVFNFPVAIQNCMSMVKLGGQLVLMTPWHNYPGHGFYQFSPELIYNTLTTENGFQVERMLIAAEGTWYSVKRPSELKGRIEISTNDPIDLYVIARRIEIQPLLSQWPQQSDYRAAWDRDEPSSTSPHPGSSLKSRILDCLPPLLALQTRWRRMKRARNLSPARNPGLIPICLQSEIPN